MSEEKEPLQERLMTKTDMWDCISTLENIIFLFFLVAIQMEWKRELMLWIVHIGYRTYFFLKHLSKIGHD